MAGVAKWLRQRVVVPPFAGSSPVTRPNLKKKSRNIKKIQLKKNYILCHATVDLNYELQDA